MGKKVTDVAGNVTIKNGDGSVTYATCKAWKGGLLPVMRENDRLIPYIR